MLARTTPPLPRTCAVSDTVRQVIQTAYDKVTEWLRLFTDGYTR